ncbi:MAG: phenylacetic acid degradation bifunctional protein PaaZ, partial [Bacteroidota bacterium]
MKLQSYAYGEWITGTGTPTLLKSAITGEHLFDADSTGIDFRQMAEYGRSIGGKKIRQYTFHQRALMLKELAKYLSERKEQFYALSYYTGATKMDSWFDIDGGFGTLFAY